MNVRGGAGTLIVAVGILVSDGCAKNYYVSAAGWTGQDEARMATSELSLVRVESRQGVISFASTPADSVVAGVQVGPARGAMGLARDCDIDEGTDVRVRVEEKPGQEVVLSLDPSPGDECVVNWRISVPERAAVEGRLDAGNLEAFGRFAGVTLETGAGRVDADVEAGALLATTQLGDIEARYTGSEYGRVELRANVGKVDLELDGRALDRGRPPGAGDRLELEGKGGPAIVLRAGVGDVLLRLGQASEEMPGTRSP